jgi:glycosyltransferase involved in cell wall biosynthesis
VNIALVVPGGVDRTGEYRVIPALLALIERLSSRHAVHVFALRQEAQPDTWQLAGAQIHNIGFPSSVAAAVRRIVAQHRRSPFDVVHGIWSGAPGLVTVTAGKLLRIPSVVHVAGGELVALADIGYGGALTARGRLREAVVLRAATAVTAASEPMLDALVRRGIAARRIALGVDLDAWSPREPRRRNVDEPARLIHVASLNRVKDQATLMHAIAAAARAGARFEVDVVGEDTLQGEIEALARELGLSMVRFRGFLPHRRLRPIMEEAHLMIVSSRHEAGPLVMLEAAVLGIPTVGTAVGHLCEYSPAAARAVPVGDAAALARAICELLCDESLRMRVASEAFGRAIQENADATANAFETLYADLRLR